MSIIIHLQQDKLFLYMTQCESTAYSYMGSRASEKERKRDRKGDSNSVREWVNERDAIENPSKPAEKQKGDVHLFKYRFLFLSSNLRVGRVGSTQMCRTNRSIVSELRQIVQSAVVLIRIWLIPSALCWKMAPAPMQRKFEVDLKSTCPIGASKKWWTEKYRQTENSGIEGDLLTSIPVRHLVKIQHNGSEVRACGSVNTVHADKLPFNWFILIIYTYHHQNEIKTEGQRAGHRGRRKSKRKSCLSNSIYAMRRWHSTRICLFAGRGHVICKRVHVNVCLRVSVCVCGLWSCLVVCLLCKCANAWLVNEILIVKLANLRSTSVVWMVKVYVPQFKTSTRWAQCDI